MNKTFRLILCIALLAVMLGLTSKANVSAESYSSYVSGITMVNLGTSSAVVEITYYRGGTGSDAGQIASSATENITAGAVKDYAAIPIQNFRGAVVISSSSPLAAMSTLTGGGLARGSYVGVSSGSQTVRLPFLAKNHGSGQWNTFFAVQNIGATDTTVNVDYAGCNGVGTNDDSKVVKANSSVIFDQATTSCLGNGITSAIVTSTTNDIVAVVDQESTLMNSALVSTGFSAGTINPVMPLINANNPTTSGWRTAITIMNVGNQATTLKLTYRRTDGSTCYEQQSIPAGQSKVFAGRTLQLGPISGVTSNCTVGARTIGAAYVANPAVDNSTQQPLVAIVNQDRGSMASAYSSFDPDNGTPKVIMPLIMDQNGVSTWSTSFNVMNVGDATTYVKCTFGSSSYTVTATLEPYRVFENLQSGKLGVKITKAECTAYTNTNYNTIDNNAKIVAVVNERGMVGNGDLLLTYEGVNVVPAP